MSYRDDYDDDRDPMERMDDEDELSEIEDAVHEQTMFEDDEGNLWALDGDEDEEDTDIPEELLEEMEEDE